MPNPAPKLTPMMAQFNAIKAQHADALVMMRLGDFYEMMGEGAGTAPEAVAVVRGTGPVGAGWRILRGGRTRS